MLNFLTIVSGIAADFTRHSISCARSSRDNNQSNSSVDVKSPSLISCVGESAGNKRRNKLVCILLNN